MAPHTKFEVGDLVVEKKTAKSPRKISRINPDPNYTDVIFYDGGGCGFKELNSKYKLFVPKTDPKKPVKFKIVDSGVKVTLKSSAKCYVTVDGVDVPIVNDFFEMMDDLSDCDGYMSRFLFDNSELEHALIASDLVFKNARGSYGPTKKFHQLYESILEEAKKVYDIKPKMHWSPTKENIENLPEPIRNYVESLQVENNNLASALTEAIRFVKYSGQNECGSGMSWEERTEATKPWEDLLQSLNKVVN